MLLYLLYATITVVIGIWLHIDWKSNVIGMHYSKYGSRIYPIFWAIACWGVLINMVLFSIKTAPILGPFSKWWWARKSIQFTVDILHTTLSSIQATMILLLIGLLSIIIWLVRSS